MKTFLIGLGAAALMVSGAAAQNSLSSGPAKSPVSNPSAVIKNFDQTSLGPVLSELGITWQSGQFDNGQNVVIANAYGEIGFYAIPTACRSQNTNCIGVQFFALFEGGANPQTVRAFNDQYPFTQTALDQNGDAMISRYEIADYGVPRGNVAVSIITFLYEAATFRNELASAGRTVALEGYADDLAASYLNRVGLQSFAGAEAHSASPTSHDDLLSVETTDQIRKLISARKAARNKIKNITGK